MMNKTFSVIFKHRVVMVYILAFVNDEECSRLLEKKGGSKTQTTPTPQTWLNPKSSSPQNYPYIDCGLSIVYESAF